MRSWISRSKNALARQLVCVRALSSCHHQFDVSVSRCAMQCGKSVLVRTPSPMKHGGKTMQFTIATPTIVPGVALAVLVDAHIGIEICLPCGPPVGSNHPKSDCSGSVRCDSSGRASHRRTPRASGPRASNAVCRGSRARPRAAARHGKIQPCQAVSSCQSRATDGLKHRAWRSSWSARHSVERDMSSELCRRSTLRVCRGVSVTAASISARTSLVRRRFSGRVCRTTTQLLDLRLDALERPVWPQCSHLAWFSAVHESLVQLSNVLQCPVNATTHGAKIAST